MGPGADAPGNTDGYGIATRDELLQWGRGQMPPEIVANNMAEALAEALQWGRGQMPPEMRTRPSGIAGGIRLQWGRGQMPPEIKAGARKTPMVSGFNGAGGRCPRKSY